MNKVFKIRLFIILEKHEFQDQRIKAINIKIIIILKYCFPVVCSVKLKYV